MVVSQQAVSAQQIVDRFPQFFVASVGDLNRTVTGVGSPEIGGENLALFLATPKALKAGLERPAAIWVVDAASRAAAEAQRKTQTILIANHVDHAMSSVINAFFLTTPYTNSATQGIHSTAIVHPSAQVGADVRIGPHAVIGANVHLEDRVYIGANSIIENGTTIGEGTVIHPLVFVGHTTSIGKNCEIHPSSVVGKEGFGYAHDAKNNHYRIPHVGRVIIEDDVHLGSCVTIDRSTFNETRIERGAKLDNNIHIGHNAQLGRNAIVTAGFLLAGSAKIGANFVTGGNTVVSGHLEICDNVQLAALSGVGKAITKPGRYGGVPLMPLQSFIKLKAAMAQLPRMRQQLRQILAQLDIRDPAEPSGSEE